MSRDYWLSAAASAVARATMSRPKRALALAEVARACIEAAKVTQ